MKEPQVIEIMNKIREYGTARVRTAFADTAGHIPAAGRHYEAGRALLDEIREALRDA